MLKKIFKYQHWQWLSAFILILAIQQLILLDHEMVAGSLWDVNTRTWLWLSVSVSIAHQFYVWLIWRLELYRNTFTNVFGLDNAFKLYKAGFIILFSSRLLFILVLAVSNRDSLPLEPAVSYLIAIIITPPAIYLGYSVWKYFTFDRAFGIDHFAKGYNEPFVKKGIFKYTNNGMYYFGFLVLYVPGLLLFSKAALLAALFNHLYIWGHYFFTEKPDMKVIYKT